MMRYVAGLLALAVVLPPAPFEETTSPKLRRRR